MKCVCCNKTIKPLNEGDLNHEDCVFNTEETRSGNTIYPVRAENRCWNDGLVTNISAGWGSGLDGDQFVLSICDDCVSEKVESGVMAYLGNSLFGNNLEVKEKIESCQKIWRRNNNLDELI